MFLWRLPNIKTILSVDVSFYVSPFPVDLLSEQAPDSISQSLVMLRSVCRMSAFTIRNILSCIVPLTAVSSIHWSCCHPSELNRPETSEEVGTVWGRKGTAPRFNQIAAATQLSNYVDGGEPTIFKLGHFLSPWSFTERENCWSTVAWYFEGIFCASKRVSSVDGWGELATDPTDS